MLIQRLDRGIRDLSQDLNDSLGKTIDAISAVINALEALGKCEGLAPGTQTEMQSADHQLMRVLLCLQVGDRTQQKTEALRATLQEPSDRLLGAEEDAPDLRVSISSFDENILPEDERDDGGKDDSAMSQDDIDALFE